MLKKMGVLLLSATACLTGSVWAQSVGIPQGYPITIPAGEYFEFSTFFEISGYCTINMDPNHSTVMTGTVIRPTITLNGVRYESAGQSQTREVHNGDSFALTASAFSSVRLKNDGQYDIKADCRLP